jgi:hypothetical protein
VILLPSNIVVKKENHSNRLDKEEERDFLREDFDTLVLEGQENPQTEWNKYSFLDGWFGWATYLFFWIMSPIYQSRDSLIEIAKLKEMNIEFTRKGDYELIDNAPDSLRMLSLVIFYGFFLGSMFYGIYREGYYYGIVLPSLFLLGAITVPIILLRIYNSRYAETENRDKKIAEIIEEASEKGRVLAIVGKAHEVERFFSEDADYTVCEAKATQRTLDSAKDYLSRGLKSYFILLSLFLVIREIMAFAITLV